MMKFSPLAVIQVLVISSLLIMGACSSQPESLMINDVSQLSVQD